MRRSPSSAAFTLVELSIVLVILGLLVGGVLTGQSLIRAAELRAVSNEAQRYQTAVYTFRDKYLGLPGDLANAQSYWGVAHATPATCVTTNSGTTATCNGNGDGQIVPSAGSHEVHRSWQHLANAGLVEGSYTGIAGPAGSTSSVVGVNGPASKFGKASGWSLYYLGSITTLGFYYPNNYGTILSFGSNLLTEDDTVNNPVMKSEEAYNIDTKLDDGKPHTGRVTSFPFSSRPECVVSTNDAYALTSTGAQACNLFFAIGF